MAVTALSLPCWTWLLCQGQWQPSCGHEGRAKAVRGVGSGTVSLGCYNKVP